MSNNVDNRVVQMDFDNAKFERGVRTTMESLTRLKKELDLSKSAKGMKELQTSDFNLKGIEDGIDRLTKKFSTASIIWQTIIQRATNAAITKFSGAINQMKTGGMTRAANIEQANFMLEGLLSSKYKDTEKRAEKLKEISDAAMKSVDGTAYGYDEASKAAAQFYASGITNGAEMEKTLLGVAGTAAMTGRDYGDIAHIFTTVSGQGRVMGEQLNQLAASGINAAATLADHLGVTEAEVREMTSKGEIDFKTFAEAMSDAFGAHAKEANKTFNGALSNMKAAMNRIGAEFYTPYRNYMRNIFNAFTPVLNAVKKMLTPVITLYDKGFKHISQHVVNFLGLFAKNTDKGGMSGYLVTLGERLQVINRSFEKMGGFYSLFVGIKNIIKRIGSVLLTVGQGFDKVFGATDNAKNFFRNLTGAERGLKKTKKIIKEFKKDIGKDTILSSIGTGYDLANLAKQFKDWTKTVKFSDQTLANLRDTFAGLFAIVDIFAMVIGEVIRALIPGSKAVGSFGGAILAVTGSIGRAIVQFDKFLKATGALKIVGTGVRIVVGAIAAVLNVLFSAFAKVTTVVSTFVDKHLNALISRIKALATVTEKIGIPIFLYRVEKALAGLTTYFGTLWRLTTKMGIPVLVHRLSNGLSKLAGYLKTLWWINTKIGLPALTMNLKSHAGKLGEVVTKYAQLAKIKIPMFASDFFKKGLPKVGNAFGSIAEGVKKSITSIDIGSMLSGTGKKVSGFLDNFRKNGFSAIGTAIKELDFRKVAESAKTSLTSLGGSLKKFGANAKTFYDTKLSDKFGKAGEVLKKFARMISSSFSNSGLKILGSIVKSISNFFTGISSAIKGRISASISALTEAGKAISKFARSISKDDILGALSGIASAIILFNRFKEMKKKAEESSGLVATIKDTFKSLSSTISSYKKDAISKPEGFKKIATGLLMLSAALYIVSKIDKDKILPALGAMGAMAVGLLVISALLDKFATSDGGFAKVAKSVLPVAASMLLMSKAFAEFAKIDSDSYIKAALTMGGCFVAIALIANVIGKYSSNVDTYAAALTVIAMGMALKMLGTAMYYIAQAAEVIASIDQNKILAVGGIIIGIMALMAGFVVAVNAFGNGGKYVLTAAIGMIALAKAVQMFAEMMIHYKDINFGEIAKGIIFVVGLMTLTAAWASVVGHFAKYAVRGAASIYLLAGGLIVLYAAMGVIGKMHVNWSAWLKVPAMLGTLAVFAWALSFAGKNLFKASVSIFLIAGALAVLSKAFVALNKVPFVKMVGSAIVLVGAIIGLLFAVSKIGASIGGAVAIFLISAALSILATALGAVAAIPIPTLAKSIISLAASLALLVLTIGLLGTVAGPGLMLVGLGLALFGAGIAALTWGLSQLIPLLVVFSAMPQSIIDKGLEMFGTIIKAIAKDLAIFGLGLAALGIGVGVLAFAFIMAAVAVKKFGQGLLWVAGGIAAIAAAIWLLGKVTGLSFSEMVEGVVNLFKMAFEAVKNFIAYIWSSISGTVMSVIETLTPLFTAVWNLLKNVGGTIVSVITAVVQVFQTVWNAITFTASVVMDTASAIISVVQVIFETIRSVVGGIYNMVSTVLNFIVSAIGGFLKSIPVVGDELSEKFDGWANGIKEKFKGKEGEEAGKEAPKAVAKGVTDNKAMVDDAVEEIGGDSGILGKFKENAGKQGEEGGFNFMNSFSGALGEGESIDPMSLFGDNLPAEFGDLGGTSADAFGGSFEEALGGMKVDGSGLATSAAETASNPKEMKKAAKTNIESYTAPFDKDTSASKAGEKLGKSSAKAALNKQGMHNAGGDNASGFAAGVASPSALKAAYDAGWKLGKKAEQGERDASDSQSPSRVFIALGKYLSQGLAIGITRYSDLVYDSAYTMTDETTSIAKDLMDRVANVINGNYDFNPTISPVVDLSNVEAGAAKVSSMFGTGPFGLNVPSTGIHLAETVAANIQNGGKSDMASSINRLAKRLESVTETMNSRSMNNYFQVDGATDPNAFADAVSDRLRLKARAV